MMNMTLNGTVQGHLKGTGDIFNGQIKDALLNRDMLGAVEDLLASEQDRYKSLGDIGGGAQGDLVLTESDLRPTLDEVGAEVDSFLGVSSSKPRIVHTGTFKLISENIIYLESLAGLGISAVSCIASDMLDNNLLAWMYPAEYILFLVSTEVYGQTIAGGTNYSLLSRTIRVPPDTPRAEGVVDIGHEYTHHVQRLRKWGRSRSKCGNANEGFAIGVERYLGDLYDGRENNPGFLSHVLRRSVHRLEGVYGFLCQQLGSSPNLDMSLADYAFPSDHAMGHTAFLLEEKAQGNGIYKQMLEGKFEFKVLPIRA